MASIASVVHETIQACGLLASHGIYFDLFIFLGREFLAINPLMSKTKIALLGAGFIADIHMESYERFVPEAEVVSVFTRNPQKAEAFAKKHHIGRWFGDHDKAIT